MRTINFDYKAFKQYNDWAKENKNIHKKIIELLEATVRNPFEGIGKPELLKGDKKAYCSRRITDEHRLVYQVTDEEIFVVSCKFHYDN